MFGITRTAPETSIFESAKSNKEWLLNPVAIRKAKECIVIIEKELGVRLKLTHPNFLEMINEYVELTGDVGLKDSFTQLAAMAGIDVETPVVQKTSDKVVPHPRMMAVTRPSAEIPTLTSSLEIDKSETVDYKGKTYPKYNDTGKTFKGLYRGQPHYM